MRSPHLILVTDDERLPEPKMFVENLPSGAAIIVRSQDFTHLKKQICTLRSICRSHGILLIAATNIKTALALDVDGVHLSEAAVRRAGGAVFPNPRHLIISAAAHSVPATRRAKKLGAKIILISPAFPTKSHPNKRTLGSIGYRRLARHAPEQACPLGGLTNKLLRRLKGAPILAVAGVSLFLDDAQPSS